MNNCIIKLNNVKKEKINGKPAEILEEIYKANANIIDLDTDEKIKAYNIFAKNIIAFKTRKCNFINNVSIEPFNYKIKYNNKIYKIINIDLCKYTMYAVIKCVME